MALGVSRAPCCLKTPGPKNSAFQHIRLLSDFWPHGKIAKAYGLFREANGFSERANIILDENQRVVFVKVYPIAQLPDLEEIFKAIE